MRLCGKTRPSIALAPGQYEGVHKDGTLASSSSEPNEICHAICTIRGEGTRVWLTLVIMREAGFVVYAQYYSLTLLNAAIMICNYEFIIRLYK